VERYNVGGGVSENCGRGGRAFCCFSKGEKGGDLIWVPTNYKKKKLYGRATRDGASLGNSKNLGGGEKRFGVVKKVSKESQTYREELGQKCFRGKKKKRGKWI